MLAAVGVLLVLGLSVGLVALPRLSAPAAAPAAATPDRPPTTELVRQLRDELALAAASNPDYPIDPAQLSAVATAPTGYTVLGRIEIPDIGLDVAYAAGVQPSVLERGPGHWPGTALPGHPGNAVLSGHRTTHTKPFADLDDLAPGDPIVVGVEGQGEVTYRVTGVHIVPEAEYVDFVLSEPADPQARRLTLFACHPKGDRTHRIVVRAQADPDPVGTNDR